VAADRTLTELPPAERVRRIEAYGELDELPGTLALSWPTRTSFAP